MLLINRRSNLVEVDRAATRNLHAVASRLAGKKDRNISPVHVRFYYPIFLFNSKLWCRIAR